MILQLIYPSSGSITLFGSDRRPAARARLGYLPETRTSIRI